MAAPFDAGTREYGRWVGRYLPTLSVAFADFAGVRDGERIVDVGCGPGGLVGELLSRGARVAAIDPAPRFVADCRAAYPAADVRQGVAEELPWPPRAFDQALASLVIAFMTDPQRGMAELRRVTRPGGTVAACMWDQGGDGMPMFDVFWAAARVLDPTAAGEGGMTGTRDGQIADYLERAGLQDVVAGHIEASATYADFDDFWEPFTYGIGPAGALLAQLPQAEQARLRELCRDRLPTGGFTLTARAWCARGIVPG